MPIYSMSERCTVTQLAIGDIPLVREFPDADFWGKDRQHPYAFNFISEPVAIDDPLHDYKKTTLARWLDSNLSGPYHVHENKDETLGIVILTEQDIDLFMKKWCPQGLLYKNGPSCNILLALQKDDPNGLSFSYNPQAEKQNTDRDLASLEAGFKPTHRSLQDWFKVLDKGKRVKTEIAARLTTKRSPAESALICAAKMGVIPENGVNGDTPRASVHENTLISQMLMGKIDLTGPDCDLTRRRLAYQKGQKARKNMPKP